MTLLANASPHCRGYGLKINRILMREESIYSYMTPDLLGSLPSDPQSAAKAIEEDLEVCKPIAQQLDKSRKVCYCKVNPASFVSRLREDLDYYTVMCEAGDEVVPGVLRVDVSGSMLRRFLNAGEQDLSADDDYLDSSNGFARRFAQMGISSDSAYLFVVHDEWFTKEDPALCPYRGILLIDPTAFLRPVNLGMVSDSDIEDGESELAFQLPFKVPGVSSLIMSVALQPTNTVPDTQPGYMSGTRPALNPSCADLPLVAPSMMYERGYDVFVRDATDKEILFHAVYNVSLVTQGVPEAPLLGVRESFKRRKLNY